MAKFARALVVLMGLGALLITLALWLQPQTVMPKIGLSATDLAQGLVGRATVRADIAGLFGGMGIALLLAGLRKSRQWTNATLLFTSCAILGRFVSLALDGQSPQSWPPIMIEAAIIMILLWYRTTLRQR